jgi:hypothetical protein
MEKKILEKIERENFCLNWTSRTNISFVENPVHHLIVGLFPNEVIFFLSFIIKIILFLILYPSLTGHQIQW